MAVGKSHELRNLNFCTSKMVILNFVGKSSWNSKGALTISKWAFLIFAVRKPQGGSIAGTFNIVIFRSETNLVWVCSIVLSCWFYANSSRIALFLNTYLRLASYDTGYKIILRDLAIVRVLLFVSRIKVKLLLDLLLLDVRDSDSAIIFCDLLQVSDYTKVFCFDSCYLEEILIRCHQAVSLIALQDGVL